MLSSSELENFLDSLFGQRDLSDGHLVITVRQHSDMMRLVEKILQLQKEMDDLKMEKARFEGYSYAYLEALDQLRLCRKLMSAAGLDTKFITVLNRRFSI